jgi:hypothetical protein
MVGGGKGFSLGSRGGCVITTGGGGTDMRGGSELRRGGGAIDSRAWGGWFSYGSGS